MLIKNLRLRRSRDISRVYGRGRFVSVGTVTAKILSNGYPDSRLAVVVGKKISKKAVLRNRIRRRLVATIQQKWQTVAPGYDIVITVREDVSELPPDQLTALIDRLMKKIATP